MVVLLVGAALATTPRPKAPPAPPPPKELACALDHLPDGKVRWTAAGVVDLLLADGTVLREIELGSAIPPEVAVRCQGTTLELFSQVPKVTLGFHQTTLDLAEVLDTLVPPDEVALAVQAAASHLAAGEIDEAAQRLAPFDASEPRVANEWLAVGRAANETAAAAAATPEEALRWLAIATTSLEAPGWPSDEAASIQLAVARSLLAAGQGDAGKQALRDLVAARPEDPAPALALGDALWTAGDKAGARAAYAAAAAHLAADRWPPELRERCKACKPP